MPAYHSAAQCKGVDRVGNVALLPIKCSVRGPVPSLPRDSKDPDIIDEALQYFKVNSKLVCTIFCTTHNINWINSHIQTITNNMSLFQANVFFRTYEIRSEADRVLIYLTLYITDCLRRLQKCSSKNQGQQVSSIYDSN